MRFTNARKKVKENGRKRAVKEQAKARFIKNLTS